MRTALTLAGVGIRRGLRSRSLLLMGVVGPLALGTVLALAFGGSGPTIKIAMLDLDRSPASKGIVDGLDKGLARTQVDLDVLRAPHSGGLGEVRSRVEDGDVGAVLVIPKGYEASMASTPKPLQVIGSGDNAIASSVVESIARSVAARTDLQRSVVAGYLAAGLDPTAALRGPPVEPAVSAEVGRYESAFDAPLYFGPLAVFLFLALGVTARTLLRDGTDGILDRIRAAPVSTREIVQGAAMTTMAQGSLAAATVILVSSIVFGASWGQPYEVVVIMATFVVSVAGLLGLVVGVATTEVQAESWTNVLAFTFAIIGGSFFGGAVLPGFLGTLGTLTPNGAAMRALIEVGPGGRSLAEVWYLLVWMFVIGVSGLLIGGRLLRVRLR